MTAFQLRLDYSQSYFFFFAVFFLVAFFFAAFFFAILVPPCKVFLSADSFHEPFS